MFFDEVILNLKAGNGGNGAVSFRREKFIPDGGPDGGRGGSGASIIFKANLATTSLTDFKHKRIFKAENGKSGMGANKTGRGGEDLVLFVPIGTQVYDPHTNDLIIDLDEEGKQYIAAKGGDGGLGNASFKTSVNRAPEKAQKGFDGDECEVRLIYKMFCDVGVIGKPNAGKSTFLSAVTNAKPKIADYPFTTLFPNLGVIDLRYDIIIIADIPGLIEGASKGLGLGDKFLKHIQRCKTLLHLIDISAEDIAEEYKIIRKELEDYDALIKDEFYIEDDFVILSQKAEIVCLNKCDTLTEDEIAEKLTYFKQSTGKDAILLSAFNPEYEENKNALLNHLALIKKNVL